MAESSNSANNDETELTMCDVLEEEKELEEDANAVLGGSDDTNCSYEKGYVSRQALYACITCSVKQEPGGVCLACSYKCHDGHEIVELYTKRNFRCDCGNSKFPGKTCSLKPDKEPSNVLNKYNQNFKGMYCVCSRPYPDPEDDTPDEMIQCVMCEDWYHGRHIGGPVADDYFEMICSKCMESHPFLYNYLNKFQYVNVNFESCAVKEECNGDVKSAPVDGEELSKSEVKCEEQLKIENDASESKHASETHTGIVEGVADVKSEMKCDTDLEQGNPDCFLKTFQIKPDGIKHGPAFWPDNWRKELCQCSSCMDLYRRHGCEYLLNLDDTILAYEESGKSSSESQYDKGLNALSKLDRVKQMEAVRAYTKMKGHLKEYLKEFADNKRTVRESDIKEFFEQMGKRQKLNNGVPHFCR